MTNLPLEEVKHVPLLIFKQRPKECHAQEQLGWSKPEGAFRYHDYPCLLANSTVTALGQVAPGRPQKPVIFL